MQKNATKNRNNFQKIAAIIGGAAVVCCWVILDYFGILELKRMCSGAKDCYTQFINDEVQS